MKLYSNEDLWNKFKDEYKKTPYSPLFYNSYIEPSSVIHQAENSIVILCKNTLAQRFLVKEYDKVSSVFAEILGCECQIRFTEDEHFADSLYGSDTPKSFTQVNESGAFQSNLIPRYTFDSFVTGNNSMQAFTVAKAISENPGTTYNPLFIYGNSGLGKTHLMHAIGNEILKKNPEKKVLYIQTEQFTTDYISSIQSNRMDAFRDKYRAVDVLLIDDIQFIANKPGTQEEFFNTFNELYSREKQIVISSDCRISEINALTERLKTRFENGFITNITAPDYEVRYAIMMKKSETMDINISREIMDQLAKSELNNVREIEGILNQFKLIISSGGSVTMDTAYDALQHLNISEVKEINTDLIINVVSRYFDVTTEEILSKNRNKKIVTARHVAMYFCRQILGDSYQKIADDFGGLNHTSVSDGCKNVDEKYHTDEDVKAYVDEIREMIK